MMHLSFLLLLFSGSFVESKTCSQFTDCSTCSNGTDCAGGQCSWCISYNSCVNYLWNICPLTARVNVAYNCPWPLPDGVGYNDTFVRGELSNLLCAMNENDQTNIQQALNKNFTDITVSNYYSFECLGYFFDAPNCTAFIAVDNPSETIHLVFSTTADPNFVSTKLGNLLSLPNFIASNTGSGRIYNIFDASFSKFWESRLAIDYNNLLTANPTYKTVITGYSVGGAIASLTADVIANRFTTDSTKLWLYTFGQPRIGDVNYAMSHDQLVPQSFRIINKLDSVPMWPPTVFNMDPSFHFRHEVWYKDGTDSLEFTVYHMAEDPSGRVSNLLSENDDNLNYFGKNFLNCRL